MDTLRQSWNELFCFVILTNLCRQITKRILRVCLSNYAKDGDYTRFFKDLERVVKSRTTISQLAIDLDMNRSNLSNILKGKVQPSFDITIKILRGLGAEIEVKFV